MYFPCVAHFRSSISYSAPSMRCVYIDSTKEDALEQDEEKGMFILYTLCGLMKDINSQKIYF